MSNDFNLTVLISGGGTTLKNLIEARESGLLQANIVQVVSSRPDAAGIEFARAGNIPVAVLCRSSFADTDCFSEAIFEVCRKAKSSLVVMAGFLKRVSIPADFENRVINIHPSLIPAFSGRGFYGPRVHAAVLDFGCKITGCTVHFVDNQYDHGPIIDQQSVLVKPKDTPASLRQRVFETECQIYPKVINWIANDRISIDNRIVIVSQGTVAK